MVEYDLASGQEILEFRHCREKFVTLFFERRADLFNRFGSDIAGSLHPSEEFFQRRKIAWLMLVEWWKASSLRVRESA